MSQADAIRTLQHASEYIFCSRIADAPGSMRGKTEFWQAMATLNECRNSIEIEFQAAIESADYRDKSFRPTLVCGLTA